MDPWGLCPSNNIDRVSPVMLAGFDPRSPEGIREMDVPIEEDWIANAVFVVLLTVAIHEALYATGELVVQERIDELSDTDTSPHIGPNDLNNQTSDELRQLAKDRGLVPHPTKPDKFLDPVTGKERLRIDKGHIDKKTGLPYNDPRAAKPHVHGYGPDGKTKIVDPSDNNPHFPIK